MSYIESLWLCGEDLDPYVLSVPEKLSKYGYALVLNRMEKDKALTAELCVHDVLTQNENPNIVIICPEHLLKSWYSTLLWDMGVEFKYFGVFEKSLNLFSDSIANYCLVTAEGLTRDGGRSILAKSKGVSLVWDLMIIDLPFSETIDIDSYMNFVKTKTKKLLINAPALERFEERCAKLAKNLLYYRDQASEAGLDGPILAGRYTEEDYNIKTINYAMDAALTSKAKRVDDMRSGIPLYKYGGNVFEEYSLEERKIYLSEEYTENQLAALIAADGKLGAFFRETDSLFANPDNQIVIYCVTSNTANYVAKAVRARYGVKNICVYDRNDTATDFIKSELSGRYRAEPRIIIADDNIGFKFINVEQVTHIINYEYPENPAVLEQRYTRAGRKNGEPVFYIFCDADYRFDGRMLRKTVLGNIDKMFHKQILDKCLLFNAGEIEKHLTALIMDLKFICDYTAEVGSAFDIIERFRVEYDASGATTAAKTNSLAKSKLKKLVNMFDLNYILAQKEINQSDLFAEIARKIGTLRGKRVGLDERMVLYAADETRGFDSSSANKHEDKFTHSVKRAAGFIAKLTGDDDDYLLIKNETGFLSDSLKLSVLISLWKHYKYEIKAPGTYREFIELYNKGVI